MQSQVRHFLKSLSQVNLPHCSCGILGFKASPFSSYVIVIVFEHQIGIVIAYCISLCFGDTYAAYDTVF